MIITPPTLPLYFYLLQIIYLESFRNKLFAVGKNKKKNKEGGGGEN